jgi:hypothetical protein
MRLPAIILVLFIMLSLAGPSQAQQGEDRRAGQMLSAMEAGTTPVSAMVVEEVSQGDKDAIPGLESGLVRLYRAALAGDQDTLATFAGQRHIDLASGTARVILEMDASPEAQSVGGPVIETIALEDGRTVQIEHAPRIAIRPDLAAAIAATGATYETAYQNWVQVLAPFTSLESLTQIAGVRYVRLPFPAQTHDLPPVQVEPQGNVPLVGTYTTEGRALTNTSAWHTAGYDGTGVNLAVFDFGFTGYAALQTSGDLPSGANLVLKDYSAAYSFGDTGYLHGAACGEIAYDMAPGSKVYLYAWGTDAEFGNAVTDYETNAAITGNKVATMSIGWVNAGPYDGTGPIDAIVNTAATTYSIFWANSAGNAQKGHYSWTSAQYSGGNYLSFAGDQYEIFGPSSGYYWSISAGYEIDVFLEWNDWNAARDGNVNHINYDLYLEKSPNGSTWNIVATSLDDQCASTTVDPTEAIAYTPTSAGYYRLYILRSTCAGWPNNFGHWMDLYSWVNTGTQNLWYHYNYCNSLTIPSEADGALAVGATFWNEDGTSPLYGLEPFSSLGPRNLAGGANPGTTVNKPNVVAPDGVSTATYGASNGVNYADGGTGFWGTSGAAPHVAGMAATVWEGYPSYTMAQVRTYIQTQALYKANGGTCGGSLCAAGGVQGSTQSTVQNNRYGWGRINLGSAPTAVKLTSFVAEAAVQGALVLWETASEHDNAGFNLYRSVSLQDHGAQLNPALIPSAAPGGDQGAAYSFLDTTVQAGTTYYYTLEDVDLSGVRTPHGPVVFTLWQAYLPLVGR